MLPDRMMPIAMTEWNYWHRPYVYGELGCVYDLADALGVAAGLHEYFRQQRHHANGPLRPDGQRDRLHQDDQDRRVFLDHRLPLMLYRRQFGSIPVVLSGNHEAVGLDVAAAWTEDRMALTVAIVNPLSESKTIALMVDGAALGEQGTVWSIAGDRPTLINQPGEPRVKIVEQSITFQGSIDAPAYSITLLRLPSTPQ
jgi:alpha-L-arabinofuranosidase